jgi:hypothetical protein
LGEISGHRVFLRHQVGKTPALASEASPTTRIVHVREPQRDRPGRSV